MNYESMLQVAIQEAKIGLKEGGIPIGAALFDSQGNLVARGHNLRVQNDDPTSHGETQCIRNAGRRRDWHTLTLVTTLSPCPMCTGTSLLFKIPKIIIGENKTFVGAEDWLKKNNVEIVNLQNQECIDLMTNFIQQHPDLWNEDIGK
jgi:creatinine deaminase